jgi:hypothetical protein
MMLAGNSPRIFCSEHFLITPALQMSWIIYVLLKYNPLSKIF